MQSKRERLAIGDERAEAAIARAKMALESILMMMVVSKENAKRVK